MDVLSGVYTKNPNFVCREIAGEFLLIPIRKKLNQVNCLYVLNETAAAFWKRLNSQDSIEKILGGITEEYDVAGEQLQNDLDLLIKDLLSIEAIETVRQ